MGKNIKVNLKELKSLHQENIELPIWYGCCGWR